MAKKETKKAGKYIVIPRSNEALKERFAIANGKRVPFDTPVILNADDVTVLKHQREPIQMEGEVNVHQIMDELRVPQAQANKIAEARANNKDMSKRLQWVPKYSVHPA